MHSLTSLRDSRRVSGLSTAVRANTSLAVNGVRGAGLGGARRGLARVAPAPIAAKSPRALAKRHKAQVQARARTVWVATPKMTIEAMLDLAEIKEVADQYKDRKTLRAWLSEVDPRDPLMKRGRRRHSP
jgi:hypothetical protein